ncbi:hypothetical protein JVU11DRAFT_10935 [Chiua virens]|nr:hypothetical protein JVU11DRAFT_10935 [Chiua virens]
MSPPRSPASPPPPPSSPAFSNVPTEIDEDGWEREHFDANDPSGPSDNFEPDTSIEFYGLQDEYYHHYHPKLTGRFFYPQ